MQLNKRVSIMLKNMDNMVKSIDSSDLKVLSDEIEFMRKRLTQPLKVAVVGFMKAGKSTLMNAILKEKVLFTGNVETTYTVSWFKYGESKSLTIVMKDGSEINAPFEDLEKWTVRNRLDINPLMDKARYIIIYYPNEILKTMELIDTPGLFSSYGRDSANTLDFLGLQEADKVTSEEAALADAIIYAFSRGVQGKDAEVLDAFSGADETASSPINAVGIFTRTDMFWDCVQSPHIKPLDRVSSVVEDYKAKPKLKKLLYNILPVSAKLVESASEINDETWSIFMKLANVEEEILLDYLMDANAFATEESDEILVNAKDRAYVLDIFTQYGVYAVTGAIRQGVNRAQIVDYLYELSGVKKVSNLILQHFGNRAYLIKLNYVLNRIERVCRRLKHQHAQNRQIFHVCERILEETEQIKMDEQAFKELEILQAFYNGEIKFNEKSNETQLLQITGEYGSYCEARLGVPSGTPIKELKKIAYERTRHWNDMTYDYGIPRQVSDAAKVIVRSCENLYYYLEMLSGYEE